jgi:DNA-binding beta-propeller fold protein YncE
VNPATGVVAAISTGAGNAPSILRTQRFHASPGRTVIASNAALVDERMLVAGGDSGVVWIDATNLTLISRVLDGWAIAGIALSPDGKTLYAVGAGGQVAAISTATRQVTATFDPSAGAPMALMRVAAA